MSRLTELARPDCPLCRGEGYVIGSEGTHAVARPCACLDRCPRCGGGGQRVVETAEGLLDDEGLRPVTLIDDGHGVIARREDGGSVASWPDQAALEADARVRYGGFQRRIARCRCQKLHDRLELFDRAQLPARHADSTLLSYKTNAWPGARSNKQRVETWYRAHMTGGETKGIVLHGPVGRGKTHLLSAVVRELVLQQGLSARFVEFSHLLAELKLGFEQRKGPAAVMAPLVRVDVLAIDEVGKGYNTEWERTIIDELISRRYNALKLVLGTTNYQPGYATGAAAANAALPDQAPMLGDRVGDRVYSRLCEMVRFVPIGGEDHRTVGRGRARR